MKTALPSEALVELVSLASKYDMDLLDFIKCVQDDARRWGMSQAVVVEILARAPKPKRAVEAAP